MNKLLRLLKFQDVLLSYLSLVNACIVFMYMHLKSSRLKIEMMIPGKKPS